MLSNSSGETAFLAMTPWMIPLPSRNVGEEQLAALTKVIEPAANGDGLAFVLANFADRCDRCFGFHCVGFHKYRFL